MMKFIVSLCFGGGFLIGWILPENSGLVIKMGPGAERSEPKHRTSRTNKDMAAAPSLRVTREKVEISRQRLTALLELPGSTALSDRNFINREPSDKDGSFERLAAWCGLDDAEKNRLDTMIQKAADERKEWEMANVKVMLASPGHWTLDFPGDDGVARAGLKQSIAAAFGLEKAAAIDAGGDLTNFFGFGTFAPDFRAGRVEISATRVGRNEQPDPEGRQMQVECVIDGKTILIVLGAPPLESSIQSVIFKELFGWDGLPGTAGQTE